MHAFAIDVDANGYKLTFQLFDPSKSGGDGNGSGKSGGSGGISIKVVDSTGKTLFDAMRNAAIQTGKPLYFSNMRCIIVSQQFAKTDMANLVDFIERPPEIRPSVRLLVSRNSTAGEILTCKQDGSYIPAETLEYVFINGESTSKVLDNNIEDITELESDGVSDIVVPAVRAGKSDLGESMLLVDGSAVFNRNKLAGFVTVAQTRGYLWMTSKVVGGILTIEPQPSRMASLEITNSSASINLNVEQSKPVFTVRVKFTTRLVEVGNINLNISDPADLSILVDLQNHAVEADIQSVVNTAMHTYNADIFSFGRMIYQQKPALWKTLSKTWTQKLQSVSVRIDVSSTVENMQGVVR